MSQIDSQPLELTNNSPKTGELGSSDPNEATNIAVADALSKLDQDKFRTQTKLDIKLIELAWNVVLMTGEFAVDGPPLKDDRKGAIREPHVVWKMKDQHGNQAVFKPENMQKISLSIQVRFGLRVALFQKER